MLMKEPLTKVPDIPWPILTPATVEAVSLAPTLPTQWRVWAQPPKDHPALHLGPAWSRGTCGSAGTWVSNTPQLLSFFLSENVPQLNAIVVKYLHGFQLIQIVRFSPIPMPHCGDSSWAKFKIYNFACSQIVTIYPQIPVLFLFPL